MRWAAERVRPRKVHRPANPLGDAGPCWSSSASAVAGRGGIRAWLRVSRAPGGQYSFKAGDFTAQASGGVDEAKAWISALIPCTALCLLPPFDVQQGGAVGCVEHFAAMRVTLDVGRRWRGRHRTTSRTERSQRDANERIVVGAESAASPTPARRPRKQRGGSAERRSAGALPSGVLFPATLAS